MGMGTQGFCADCPYWDRAETSGVCRRYPPTPLVGAGYQLPLTRPDAWCGEHPRRQAGAVDLELVRDRRVKRARPDADRAAA